MIQIADAFKDHKAFIPFITAGDPSIAATEKYILAMVDSGASLIEIGIPFSDPIAEGVVIQEADLRSLSAGTRVDDIFEMVARLRKKTDVPMVFMGYANPFFYYGYDAFFKRCQEVGIQGAIIPDIPFEEKHEVSDVAEKYGVTIISMIAPTSEARIKAIASEAQGFIYLVSSMGVTGTRDKITTDLESIIAQIKAVTDVPVCVGFGIHSPEQAEKIAAISDGVIVGSAIVKRIAKDGENAEDAIRDYVGKMAAATERA